MSQIVSIPGVNRNGQPRVVEFDPKDGKVVVRIRIGGSKEVITAAGVSPENILERLEAFVADLKEMGIEVSYGSSGTDKETSSDVEQPSK